MPLGIVVLVVIELIIYFGLAEKLISKMGLSKKALLLIFAAMIAGSFVDIPISKAPLITINLGGAIVPIVLAVYILSKIETKKLYLRAIIATLITGGIIYALTSFYQFEEGHTLIDTNYLFPIIAGVVAYLIGRTQKASFIAGSLGFLIYDLIHIYRITLGGVPGEADIGGAGAFDSIVIGGLIALLLSEIIGESPKELADNDNEDKGNFNKSEFAHSNMEIGEIGYQEDEGSDDNE